MEGLVSSNTGDGGGRDRQRYDVPGQHVRVHARLFASAAARFFAAFSLENGPSRCVVLPVEVELWGGELLVDPSPTPAPAPVWIVSEPDEAEAAEDDAPAPSPKVAAE